MIIVRIFAIYLILRVYEMVSPYFDGTVPYWSLVRIPQFFTNIKIIFFYPCVTDQSLQKVLTTDNTSYSTSVLIILQTNFLSSRRNKKKNMLFNFDQSLLIPCYQK